MQNRSQNFLSLPIQVLLILPNLWILGFAMSFPQVKNISSHSIQRLKIATLKTRSRSCGEYLKLVKFYFLLDTFW